MVVLLQRSRHRCTPLELDHTSAAAAAAAAVAAERPKVDRGS